MTKTSPQLDPLFIMCLSTIIHFMTDEQLFSLSQQFKDILKDSGKKNPLSPCKPECNDGWMARAKAHVLWSPSARSCQIPKEKKNPLIRRDSAVVNSIETVSDPGDNKSSPQGWRFFWQQIKLVHFLHQRQWLLSVRKGAWRVKVRGSTVAAEI